jgi:hypothetical protein
MPDPFHRRFNIDVPIEEARRRFINRIENRVRRIVEMIGDAAYRPGRSPLDSLMLDVETALGQPHLQYLNTSNTFVLTWRERIANDFSKCLLAVEALHQALTNRDVLLQGKLSAATTETIKQSEVDLGISWQHGLFVKKGAELLDEKLVNESLRWLADPQYQNVLIPFQKGLSHLLEGTKDSQRYGDAVTDMYEALEAMAKIVTGKPTRDLSALREEYITKLRLPEHYKTMLKEYIDYGCDFRHALETGQQRSWPLDHEAESFIYVTGLFIRLAIESAKAGS